MGRLSDSYLNKNINSHMCSAVSLPRSFRTVSCDDPDASSVGCAIPRARAARTRPARAHAARAPALRARSSVGAGQRQEGRALGRGVALDLLPLPSRQADGVGVALVLDGDLNLVRLEEARLHLRLHLRVGLAVDERTRRHLEQRRAALREVHHADRLGVVVPVADEDLAAVVGAQARGEGAAAAARGLALDLARRAAADAALLDVQRRLDLRATTRSESARQVRAGGGRGARGAGRVAEENAPGTRAHAAE